MWKQLRPRFPDSFTVEDRPNTPRRYRNDASTIIVSVRQDESVLMIAFLR